MTDSSVASVLAALLSELVDGTPPAGGYMLNRGDPGLLRSLERIPAPAASTVVNGGASIAAHVDHVAYGLSLMNRWAAGENPWKDADWKASWTRHTVTEDGWRRLRASLAEEALKWSNAIREPRPMTQEELAGVAGSVVHLAYHLGAIRQMDRTLRGPSAND